VLALRSNLSPFCTLLKYAFFSIEVARHTVFQIPRKFVNPKCLLGLYDQDVYPEDVMESLGYG